MSKPGEYVGIEFSSADASTAAAVTLKDANGVTRTLATTERLLIDTLSATLAAAVTLAQVFDDADAGADADAGERIASFGPNCGNFDGGCEGFPCGIGRTPKVIAGAGQVTITGAGRIVYGRGNGVRPAWKE